MKKKQLSLKEQEKIWYKKLEGLCLVCGSTPVKNKKTLKKECPTCQTEPGKNIEQDEDNLKVWSSVFFLRNSVEQIQAKQAYYQMASSFLEDHKFETRREEVIWAYHAEGISYRDISRLLKKVRVKLSHTSVQTVIHKLQIAMYLMYKMPNVSPQ